MRRDSRFHVVAWAMALMFVAALCPVRAATPDEVEDAIRRGIDSLYKKQKNGNWEIVAKPTKAPKDEEGKEDHGKKAIMEHQWGGYTAIATYALLAAGESYQKPELKKAIEFLATAKEMEGTYSVGLRAQVWNFLPPSPMVRECVLRDGQILMKNMRTKSSAAGLYSYTSDGDGWDHSCSNYGVLGMWAAALAGYEVPMNVWKAFDTSWRRNQFPDGGWAYAPGKEKDGTPRMPRLTMTTAAVATLFITQDYMYAQSGLNCTGNIVDPNIERGLKWISSKLTDFKAAGMYGAYNIERIGVASGLKYFGNIDWYKMGSTYLVSTQKSDGSWGGIPETAWGILFLVRGRAPVMMNKLEFSFDKRPLLWNERPRDIANLVKWTGKAIEKDLNWQIVNLRVNTDDLHDAPILYISGKESLAFSEDEKSKLKKYIQHGGIVLGHANCNNASFANSFKKLGEELFNTQFRELPDEHTIFTSQQYRRANWKTKPVILGLSNGVREMMLLYPTGDPAKAWQAQMFAGGDREAQAQAAANIFLYSVDKQNLRFKGDTYIIKPLPGSAKKTLKVARIQHDGNFDPEPGGWERLSAVLFNQKSVKIEATPLKLGEGKLDKSYVIAHLTGTKPFKLSDAEKKELAAYVEAGGTVVVDAAGGSAEFTVAAEAEIKAAIPAAKDGMKVLSRGHEVYTTGPGGFQIDEVEYRLFARRTLGNLRTPRVRGAEGNNRTVVFFSNEDLSAGLVGQPVDGILGYIPTSVELPDGRVKNGATEIMINLIHYAAAKNPAIGKITGSAPAAPAKPAAKAPAKAPEKGKTPAKK